MAQPYKGANEYTKLNQVRVCNHWQRPPFFRLEGSPSEKEGKPPGSVVSHSGSIAYLPGIDKHKTHECRTNKALLIVVTFYLILTAFIFFLEKILKIYLLGNIHNMSGNIFPVWPDRK